MSVESTLSELLNRYGDDSSSSKLIRAVLSGDGAPRLLPPRPNMHPSGRNQNGNLECPLLPDDDTMARILRLLGGGVVLLLVLLL